MALGTPGEFDDWAGQYDRAVRESGGFPFDGYGRVLSRVVDLSAPTPPCTVLDLGVGTGNLARLFVDVGGQVRGLDFSPQMLAKAAVKLPGVPLAQADILGAWPADFCRTYDRIVSAYVFHHFEQAEKIALLHRLRSDHLAPGGLIVVADLAFPSTAALDDARTRAGDAWDEEHYWIVERDLPACHEAGLPMTFEQVSEIAGVFVLCER